MELLSGFALVIQQFKALFKKNAILTWRNRRSAISQLLSPLFFMFLLFIISRLLLGSMKANDVRDPLALIPSIPPCEEKLLIKPPCYDLAWSGNESVTFTSIVNAIMKNNPGRPIPPSKVKSFRTKKEVDDWLFNDPMHCPAILHFKQISETVISYGIQTNSSQHPKLGLIEDPTLKFQVPLQIAAEREISRFFFGDLKFIWNVAIKIFAHPAEGMSPEVVNSIILRLIAPAFFLTTSMFGFVFQLSSVIAEKELKLRQAMNLMGLYDTAYWGSWLAWETIVVFTSSLLIVLSGMVFQSPIILRNSFPVVFLVFFLFQFSMIGFAFTFSTIVKKASSATTVGFFIFIISFLLQPLVPTVVGFLSYEKTALDQFLIFLCTLFPPNLLSIALSELVSGVEDNSSSSGIRWSQISNCMGLPCAMSLGRIFIQFLQTFFIWFILAIYLDNVIPNSSGVRKPVYYFLKPGYWLGNGDTDAKEGGFFSWKRSVPQPEFITPEDEDVRDEENTVKHQVMDGISDPDVAVQIQGLVKTYPGKTHRSWWRYFCCCCCCCFRKTKKTPPYHAVKGLFLNIPKDQLFCLLGPNGAGKTTTIGCLTGITPVTRGDALVYGQSLRSSTGMSNIRKIMGVCPQFDILWEDLTGMEHLQLFACIKGLQAATIESVVQTSLAEVRLKKSGGMRASSYSGGMKRRLSVAIALIGDPKLVILDEPTTGMDPISRRHVWEIIQNAKRGRAIILTTHSMQEADILSDRIAIMAKGALRCIGTPLRLKSKFGTGTVVNVSFTDETVCSALEDDVLAKPRREALKTFFYDNLSLKPKEETKYFHTYVIPYEKESILKDFFAELEQRVREFGINTPELGLSTLEEVFLNVVQKASLENAAIEESLETLTLKSGISLLVPTGIKHVGIPGSDTPENPKGLMVEVYWGQDPNGNLCITGHSDESPMPDVICNSIPPATGTLGVPQQGPLRGIVLDF